MRAAAGLVTALLLLTWGENARGELLGLPEQLPLVQAGLLEVQYTASTDGLTVGPHPLTGNDALTLTDGGAFVNDPIEPGTFSLTATIDALGGASGGTLKVTGDLGGGEATLFYSTSLLAFGFDTDAFGSGDTFELVFLQQNDPVDGTDEVLASIGTPLGVVLSFDSAFNANDSPPFGSDFATGAFDVSAFSKTFPIPEPSSASLLVIGSLAVAACRLARRRSH